MTLSPPLEVGKSPPTDSGSPADRVHRSKPLTPVVRVDSAHSSFVAPDGYVSLHPPFRPAATPTAAGLTPGFEFLVAEAKRKKRRRLVEAIRSERAVRRAQVKILTQENDRLRQRLDQVITEMAEIRAAYPASTAGGGM